MDFRASDEELFEDSPEEYICRDIETRRRAACDLVKTLSQNFEAKIFEIFSQYLQVLMAKYAENPAQNWRTKDTAIFLVTSLASRGVTQQIVPELERTNFNELPVIKADPLKLVLTFCSVLGPQTMLACMPYLIRHLGASSIVVHSYAACGIEKILPDSATMDLAIAVIEELVEANKNLQVENVQLSEEQEATMTAELKLKSQPYFVMDTNVFYHYIDVFQGLRKAGVQIRVL